MVRGGPVLTPCARCRCAEHCLADLKRRHKVSLDIKKDGRA